jgi:hypothetical protein
MKADVLGGKTPVHSPELADERAELQGAVSLTLLLNRNADAEWVMALFLDRAESLPKATRAREKINDTIG